MDMICYNIHLHGRTPCSSSMFTHFYVPTWNPKREVFQWMEMAGETTNTKPQQAAVDV